MNPADATTSSASSPKGKVKTWLVPIALGAAMVAVVIVGVMLTNNEADRQASASSVAAAQVTVTADGLDVDEVRIHKGQSVIWESQDNTEHQLALSAGTETAPGFGTGTRLDAGKSYTYVFDAAGTFHYYDALHPLQLNGTIIVTE